MIKIIISSGKTEEKEDNWHERDVKSATLSFINHIYKNYYKSYKKESEFYESRNNIIYLTITVLGFLVSALLGINEIYPEMFLNNEKIVNLICFILPFISSFLLMYWNQKGFKRKEEIRELARIESKHLINEAKIRFAQASNDQEYEQIYNWLNANIKEIQLMQANEYFAVHNSLIKTDKA